MGNTHLLSWLLIAFLSPLSYVKFAMNKVNMLKYHGITPYIVFDGGPLPAKAKTETDRAACVAFSSWIALF